MLSQINRITLIKRKISLRKYPMGSTSMACDALKSQLKNNPLLTEKEKQKYEKIIQNYDDLDYFTITGYNNSNVVTYTTAFLPEVLNKIGIKGAFLLYHFDWFTKDYYTLFDELRNKIIL